MSRRATPAEEVTIEDDIVVENSIDIDALEASVNTLTADIATNTVDIATHATYHTAHTAAIQSQANSISANTSAITTMQNTGSMQTVANTSAIATLQSDVATINTQRVINTGAISANAANITANTTAIAALGSPAFEYAKEENQQTILVAANGGTAMLNQMDVSITPSSASKKILLIAHIMGEWSTNPHDKGIFIRRTVGTERVVTDLRPTVAGNRGSIVADFNTNFHSNNGSTMETSSFIYVDEPNTTSQVAYTLFLVNTHTNAANFFFNRTKDDSNNSNYERGVSTMTAEEKG